MKKKFVQEVKEIIIDKLNDYEGVEVYGCDLGYKLTENENATGSWFCSRFESEEFIKNNFDVCADFYEYMQFNFGKDYAAQFNPFADAENFVTVLFIEAVNIVINSCEFVSDIWDEEIEITTEVIDKIKSDLENVNCVF